MGCETNIPLLTAVGFGVGSLAGNYIAPSLGDDLSQEFRDTAKYGRASEVKWCEEISKFSQKLADHVKASSDDPAATPAFVITQQDCENVLKPTPTKPAPAPSP